MSSEYQDPKLRTFPTLDNQSLGLFLKWRDDTIMRKIMEAQVLMFRYKCVSTCAHIYIGKYQSIRDTIIRTRTVLVVCNFLYVIFYAKIIYFLASWKCIHIYHSKIPHNLFEFQTSQEF